MTRARPSQAAVLGVHKTKMPYLSVVYKILMAPLIAPPTTTVYKRSERLFAA
jgi:hypothetical protein